MNKEIYLIFENDAEFEFEFQLAARLHMTVGDLRKKMDNWEFAAWAIFFGREAQRRQLAEAQAKGS